MSSDVPLCLKRHELAYISSTIVIVKKSSNIYQLYHYPFMQFLASLCWLFLEETDFTVSLVSELSS